MYRIPQMQAMWVMNKCIMLLLLKNFPSYMYHVVQHTVAARPLFRQNLFSCHSSASAALASNASLLMIINFTSFIRFTGD